jgi:hypothetical protein
MTTNSKRTKPASDPFNYKFQDPSPNPEALSNSGGQLRLDLDKLDFGPILDLAEKLLPLAQRLADWSPEGTVTELIRDDLSGEWYRDGALGNNGALGNTGCSLLQKLAAGWMNFYYSLWSLQLWTSKTEVSGKDQDRLDVVESLRDLAATVFRDYRPYGLGLPELDEATKEPRYQEVPVGIGLGMPHAEFARRLAFVVKLLRSIVKKGISRKGMTVEEANDRARELIANQKAEFFKLSQRQQAELIGCAFETWTKTACYAAAVKRGRIPEPKRKKARSGSTRATVSLTPTIENMHGDGQKDEVLHRLVAEEEKLDWKNMTPSEQRRFYAEHDADVAANPSPLDDSPKKVRNAKRL